MTRCGRAGREGDFEYAGRLARAAAGLENQPALAAGIKGRRALCRAHPPFRAR
ncbi:MAG TPA: hypothetical protein VMR62_08810 [Bryobacteraceae bacterium]|nr:hypothetical protein [Bryobacteraceae bacterium]